MVRRACLGLVLLGLGCSDRALATGSDDASSDACVDGEDCPCDLHADCPVGATCVDERCSPTCGNGVVDPGEQCEPDMPTDGGPCNAACLVPGGAVAVFAAPFTVTDLASAPDGTLVLVGNGMGDDSGAWFARMDPSGQILVADRIDLGHADGQALTTVRAVSVVADADIVATGGKSGEGAWIGRFSPDGAPRWQNQYGADVGEPFHGVTVEVAGEEILVVALSQRVDDLPTPLALRLDGDGGESLRVEIAPEGGLFDGWGIAVDPRGDAWFAGALGEDHRAYLGRISPGGAQLEPQPVDAEFESMVSGVGVLADGGLVLAGEDASIGLVVAQSGDGSPTWRWRSDAQFSIVDLAIDPAGHVVVVGSSDARGLIVKLRADGEVAWTYAPAQAGDGYHAVALDEDGFVYAASLEPSGAITKIAP